MHIANKALARLGFFLKRTSGGYLDFDSLVLTRASGASEFRFVQIGANDGVTADPIRPLLSIMAAKPVGIVVEPVLEYFQDLTAEYAVFNGVMPMRVAIHPSRENLTLFYPSKKARKSAGSLAKGIASADPEHWKKSSFLSSQDQLQSENVTAISVNALLENFARPLDLLLVDTEGMDFEILMDLDLSRFSIGMIRFEHGLRDSVMSADQLKTLITRLNQYDYQVFLEPYDAVAIRTVFNGEEGGV